MTEIIKYEDDFHGWVMSTASLLREKRYDQVDYNHIIEDFMSGSKFQSIKGENGV